MRDITDEPSTVIPAVNGTSNAYPYVVDPKHPPSDLDEPASAMRSGGDGHTAPPSYLRTEQVGALARSIDEPSPTQPTVRNQYLHATDPGSRAASEPERLDAPSPTVATTEVKDTRASAASGGDFHGGPDRASDMAYLAAGVRRLTVEEVAALQDFPPGYPFQGNKSARYKSVGNACPRKLTAAVASGVFRALGLPVMVPLPDPPAPTTLPYGSHAPSVATQGSPTPAPIPPYPNKDTPMATVHLEELTLNVKGGTVTVALGPKTLLLGPNGSGKSAIVAGVELLLDHSASDVSGRDQVRAEAELRALAPGRDGELFVAGRLNTGERLGWSLGVTGKGGSGPGTAAADSGDGSPLVLFPDWLTQHLAKGATLLPLRDAKAAILSSADNARKTWLDAAGATLSNRDVLGRFGGEDSPMAKEYSRLAKLVLAGAAGPVSATAMLLAVSEEAKRQKLEAGREARTLEASLNRVTEGLQPEPTEDQLAQAHAQVGETEAGLRVAQVRAQAQANAQALAQAQAQATAQVVQAQASTQASTPLHPLLSPDEISARYNAILPQITEVQALIPQWEQYLTGLAQSEPQAPAKPSVEVPPLGLSEIQLALETAARWHLQTGQVSCAVCQQVAPGLPDRLKPVIAAFDAYRARVDAAGHDARTALADWEAAVTRWEADHAAWRDQAAAARQRIDEMQAWEVNAREEAERLRVDYASATAQEAQAQAQAQAAPAEAPVEAPAAAPVDADANAVPQAIAAHNQAQAQLARLLNAAAAYKTVNRLRQDLAQAEARQKACKELEGACKSAIMSLTASVLEGFVSNVQRYLPQGWSFGIDQQTSRPGLWKTPPKDGGLRWEHAAAPTGAGTTGAQATAPNAVLLTALSGAEWATVTAAMATVIGGANPCPLQVVIPEDRGWDGETLAAAMRGLSKAPQQVILCSTTAPKGHLPAGWTVVEVDALSTGGAPQVGPKVEPAPVPVPALATPAPVIPPPSPPLAAPTGVITGEQAQQLRDLRYDNRQINRMKPSVALRILSEGIDASKVAILNNGEMAPLQGPPPPMGGN